MITEQLMDAIMEKQKDKTEITPKPAESVSSDSKTVNRRTDRTPEPGAAK